MFSDRTPHPALFQAQRAQQFFQFAPDASEPWHFTVSSDYLFRHSDNEVLRWRIEQQGEIVAQGEMAQDLPPQGTQRISVTPLENLTGECWLNVAVHQRNATAWSDADCLVA